MKSLFIILLSATVFTVHGQILAKDGSRTNSPIALQKEQGEIESSSLQTSKNEASQFTSLKLLYIHDLDLITTNIIDKIATNIVTEFRNKIKPFNIIEMFEISSTLDIFQKDCIGQLNLIRKNVRALVTKIQQQKPQNVKTEDKLILTKLETLIQQQKQSETKIQSLQTMLWILLIPIVLGFVCKIWKHRSSSKQDDFSSENQKLNDQLASLSQTIGKMQKSFEKIQEKPKPNNPRETQSQPDVVPIVKRKIEGEEHKDYISIITDLFRLKNNLGKIDDSQPGKHQAENAVRRLETTLETKGYTFESPLNQPYNDGMAFSASFIHDETLPAGTAVITRVSSPQINFSGKMIQCASGTVSKN